MNLNWQVFLNVVYFFPFPSERCVHLLIDFLNWAQFIRPKKKSLSTYFISNTEEDSEDTKLIKIQYWKSILFSIQACIPNWMPHKYFRCYSAWNSTFKAQSYIARFQMCKTMVSFVTYTEQYCIKMYLRTSELTCDDLRSISFLRFHRLWQVQKQIWSTRRLLPAILANISLNPISTYWGICHQIGKSAAW